MAATLTDAVRREPEPVAEDAPALVVRVERQQTVEAVLLLATAPASAQHLLLLVPENGARKKAIVYCTYILGPML